MPLGSGLRASSGSSAELGKCLRRFGQPARPRHHRRRTQPWRRRRGRVHPALRRSPGRLDGRPDPAARAPELALTRITVAQREALKSPPSACAAREAEAGFLALHRGRRHRCSASRSPAGPRRALCAGRQASHPSSGADECDPGQGRRGVRSGHGRTDPARRDQRESSSPPPASPASTVSSPSAGAQAVAALVPGTESVPRVDKIVGPGNIYGHPPASPGAWPGRHRRDRRSLGNPRGLRWPELIRTGSPWTCSPGRNTTKTPSRS